MKRADVPACSIAVNREKTEENEMKNRKKFSAALLSLVLSFCFCFFAFASEAGLELSQTVTKIGEEKTVSVKVSAHGAGNVFKARIETDGDVFESIKKSDITPCASWGDLEFNEKSGELVVVGTDGENEEILTVLLHVKENASASSADFYVSDAQTSNSKDDISLGSKSVGFELSSDDNQEPDNGQSQGFWQKIIAFFAAIIAAIKSLFGKKKTAALLLPAVLLPVMALGAAVPTSNSASAAHDFEFYDINGDMRIGTEDYGALSKMLIGLEPKNEKSDLNGDSRLSVTDLSLCVNYVRSFDKTFSCVSQMKKYNAQVGELLSTRGFESENDGGAAIYEATRAQGGNDVTLIELSNGLFAKLLENKDGTSVKCFGAKGDSKADDSAALELAVNSGFETIVMPNGDYLLSSPVAFEKDDMRLVGEGARIVFEKGFSASVLCINANKVKLENLEIFADAKQTAKKEVTQTGFYDPIEKKGSLSDFSIVCVNGSALLSGVSIFAQNVCDVNLILANGTCEFKNGSLFADETCDLSSVASGRVSIENSRIDCLANYTNCVFENIEALRSCEIGFNCGTDVVFDFSQNAETDIDISSNTFTLCGSRTQDIVLINLENNLCGNSFAFSNNILSSKEQNESKTLINCAYGDSEKQNVKIEQNKLETFVMPKYKNGFDFDFCKNTLNGALQNDFQKDESCISADSVEKMKENSLLAAGDTVQTLGFYEKGDGGSAKYEITNDALTADGGNVIALSNGLFAKIVIENGSVTAKQFGAKADGKTDDAQALSLCLNSEADYVFLNHGKYRLCRSFGFSNGNKTVFGNDSVFFTDDGYNPERGSEFLFIVTASNAEINNLSIQARETTVPEKLYSSQMYIGDNSNLKVISCNFNIEKTASSEHGYNNIDMYTGWHDITIQNCELTNVNEASSGGCIWIRDLFSRKCDNLNFIGNKCVKKTHDEILAVFMGYIDNVTIKSNSFIMPDNERDRTVMCFTFGSGYSSKQASNIFFENNDLDCSSSMSLAFANGSSNVKIKNNKIKYTKPNVQANNFTFYNASKAVDGIEIAENEIELFNESAQSLTAVTQSISDIDFHNNNLSVKSDMAEAFGSNTLLRENKIVFDKTLHVFANKPKLIENNNVTFDGQTDILIQYYGGELTTESQIKNNVFIFNAARDGGSCLMVCNNCSLCGFVPTFTGNTVTAPNAQATKNRLYFLNLNDETSQRLDMTGNKIEGFKGSYVKNNGTENFVDLENTELS